MRGHKSNQGKPSLDSLKKRFGEIGSHYFQNSAGSAMAAPVFDLGSNGVLFTKKVTVSPSPLKSSRNVPWLMLEVTQGTFAKTIFRTYTRGGQPPEEKCSKAHENIEESYAAVYWMYK
ncbi:hypothetical protein O181_043480 [Austropuccinia psidii MF-1]|uniref:Uncharacterized protein n=1 Tax=Austropuccinia psidii MF-1 TaxID=1389203 RepID=A0A9Q3DMM9_9BASI|nr:hypothetical protein [Austropuccinia psidii MF-1]